MNHNLVPGCRENAFESLKLNCAGIARNNPGQSSAEVNYQVKVNVMMSGRNATAAEDTCEAPGSGPVEQQSHEALLQ